MIPSLRHYWRIHLAVAVATSVAAAVLAGALLVGDSVRGSLRNLFLDRLGRIDRAILSENFFEQRLAGDLEGVPAIILTGSATSADSKTRASGVQIVGINHQFEKFFADSRLHSFLSPGVEHLFPAVIINESLGKELNVEVGDQILFAVKRPGDIPHETLLGTKDPSEMVRTLRLSIARVLPDRGVGAFRLDANQKIPLNAYVSLDVLQKILGMPENINAILLAHDHAKIDPMLRLKQSWQLPDAGMLVRETNAYFSLESKGVLLKDSFVRAAIQVSRELGLSAHPVFTYLANKIAGNGKSIPYSTISAIDTRLLDLTNGKKAKELTETEILLNEWAAQDLGVTEGDRIVVTYFLMGPGNRLLTGQQEFTLRGIVALKGWAADPSLTPDFPGIQDADHISDWSPPFPIDLSLIRPKDEEYWEKHRATPKAFVWLAAGQKLWGSRFGNLTSLRFENDPKRMEGFRERLLARLNPREAGFLQLNVKEQGLRAASGSTDFSGLFLAFSFFLIASSALLIGLLFRLGVEQRVREIGILLSVGYPAKAVRNRFLFEGFLLTVAGALPGIAAGVLYARMLLIALQTWWSATVGSPFLSLHFSIQTLLIAYVAAIAIACISIWRAVFRVVYLPPTFLLAKSNILDEIVRPRVSRWIALCGIAFAASLTLYAVVRGGDPSPAIFFAAGACSLISGLAFLAGHLRSSTGQPLHATALPGLQMAIRTGARNPGRSILSAALVSSACFVIVAAVANRKTSENDDLEKNSGTGGYTLIAESDIPVLQDLNAIDSREAFGIRNGFPELHFIPFRLLPGDDASCLNLYRPQQPRILGVPSAQMKRGGFEFRQTLEDRQNPWELLDKDMGPGVIPAIGDYNSVVWILHLKLGNHLILNDESGKPLKLRLVGLLNDSIFQSEILISEANFTKYYPSRSGYSYFLMNAPVKETHRIAQELERALERFGFDVSPTVEKLARFHAVENTYLATFQILGGLGLLLGTIGLGTVLIRNVIERRGELAMLQAVGYRRRTISFLTFAENALMLLTGILLGTCSALVAVTPHLLRNAGQIPWSSLLITLFVVLFTGILASTIATSASLRTPLLPALKAE